MIKEATHKRRFGLIKTKLIPADPGTNTVRRDQMIDDVLSDHNAANVVSIVGAAGSGKSVLLGQLHQSIAARDLPSSWINLEKEDNELSAFLSYFTASLTDIDPTLAERAFQMIDSNYVGEPEAIFQTICEDISSVSVPFFIFLDDFQHITDQAIIVGLDSVITSLPASGHMVIASRAQLPLSLSRRKIAGTLLEIDQQTLNFSLSETESMLGAHSGLNLGREDVQTLSATTEGWAAGLRLAALALMDGSNGATELVSNFTGTNQNLTDYLMESVFRRQSEEVQEFLLRTSPLARMNKEVCEVISGQTNAGETLHSLKANNLFLVSLDSQGTWFRYHHLFSEFLVAQLRQKDEALFQQVCGDASDWFLAQGLNTEAVQYLLSAERHAEAATLIAQKGLEVAQHSGDHRTILDWVRRLPVAFHNHHPLIRLNYAWSLMFTRSAVEARQIAQEIRVKLKDTNQSKWHLTNEETQSAQCLTDVIESISYAGEDASDTARDFTEESLENWPSATNFQKASLYNSLAYSCIGNVEYAKGLEAAEKARRFGLQSNADYATVWSDWISAIICIKMGKLKDAEAHLGRGRERSSRFMGSQSHANTLITILLAEVMCDRGDFEKAHAILGENSGFFSIIGPMEPKLILRKTEARILAGQGQIDKAIELLRGGQESGLINGTPRLSLFLAAEELKLLLVSGDVENALTLAKRWGFVGDNNVMGVSYDRDVSLALQRQMRARLLIGQEEYGKALAVISDLVSRSRAQHRGRSTVELLILKADSLWNLGRESEALRAMANATELAAPERYAAPFLEFKSPSIEEMLGTMVKQRSGAQVGYLANTVEFESSLLTKITGVKVDANTSSAAEYDDLILEKLTKRETQILNLLADGLSNDQLAETLLVSVPTVKWHLHNIYEKLDVRNRTAAIASGRRLNIIQ